MVEMFAPLRERPQYISFNNEINELICRYFESYQNQRLTAKNSDAICLKTWKLIQYIKKEIADLHDEMIGAIPSFDDAIGSYYCISDKSSYQSEIAALEALSRAAYDIVKRSREPQYTHIGMD